MRCLYVIFIFLLASVQSFSQNDSIGFALASQFKLAKPKLVVDSILFYNQARVRCEMDFPDADIMIRKNSGEWEGCNEPLFLERTGTWQAKVVHSSLQESEIVSQTVFKIGHNLAGTKIGISPNPNKKYAGEGAQSLVDLRIGTLDFRKGSRWLGIQVDTFDIDLNFETLLSFQSVTLSSLCHQDAWIFLPQKIMIFAGNELVAAKNITEASIEQKNKREFIRVEFPTLSSDKLAVKIISLSTIPHWHPGAGSQPWFFVDEILIN